MGLAVQVADVQSHLWPTPGLSHNSEMENRPE